MVLSRMGNFMTKYGQNLGRNSERAFVDIDLLITSGTGTDKLILGDTDIKLSPWLQGLRGHGRVDLALKILSELRVGVRLWKRFRWNLLIGFHDSCDLVC